MHGLIFVTWEKYIAERFGNAVLYHYRAAIGEIPLTAPLANRIYDDATLIAGVQALCKLSGVPANTLLREYGRYFIMNGLTNHLCAYFLTRVQTGRELLLIMREGHQQMRRTPDGITPPLFRYESLPNDPQGIVLIYDSPRKLCPILYGAIEGAAERYGERVQIVERTCMKYGADACRFEVHFQPLMQSQSRYSLLWQQERINKQKSRQHLADIMLSLLPDNGGITMGELQERLHTVASVPQEQVRPRIIFEGLRHLQYAGLITSTANQPGDVLTQRRFWRVPTHDQEGSVARVLPPQHTASASATSATTASPQNPRLPRISSRQTKRLNERRADIPALASAQPYREPRKQETGSLLLRYRRQQNNSH